MSLFLAWFISCVAPTLGFIAVVFFIHWLLDRLFGEDSDQINVANRMQAEFMQNARPFGLRKARESKVNPHYDALVDAEWRAERLADTLEDADASDEIRLADLLEKKP